MCSLNSKKSRLKRTSKGSEKMSSRIKKCNLSDKKMHMTKSTQCSEWKLIQMDFLLHWEYFYINLAHCGALHFLFKIRENDSVFSQIGSTSTVRPNFTSLCMCLWLQEHIYGDTTRSKTRILVKMCEMEGCVDQW